MQMGPITIHPWTLCFSDFEVEQQFRVEQLRQVIVFNKFGNSFVFAVVAATIARSGENTPAYVYISAITAFAGLATALPVGRLNNGVTEYNSVVYGGLANIICGYSTMCYLHIQTPSAVLDVVSFTVFLCAQLLVILATHVLVFPFWARLFILLGPAFLLWIGPVMSELGNKQGEMLLLGVISLIGEFVGSTLQRGVRRLHIEKLDLKEQKAAIAERNEQLACEKERVSMMYAMELEKTTRTWRSRGARQERSESNHSESNQSNEELKGWLAGSGAGSSHAESDLPDTPLLDRSFAPISTEHLTPPGRRERKKRLWRTLEEMGILCSKQPKTPGEAEGDSKLPLPGEVEAEELLDEWEESESCASSIAHR